MKVGPVLIEKEPEHQLWRVSLTLQHMSYFTRWYSSHLYTPREAVEKFIDETLADLGAKVYVAVFPSSVPIAQELLEQVKIALIFLEAQE